MKATITTLFHKIFSAAPAFIVHSPGRINIIGEHTDYNNGFVLPAAIDKGVYLAINKRDDDQINLYAALFNEHFNTTVSSIKKSTTLWANYVLGVVNEFTNAGEIIGGFNAVIASDLPVGAGLSSSAAVECATAFALNNLFNLGIEKTALIQHAQKAEHNFAGVMCGIMDQFASMMGKKDYCIKLDCQTLSYQYIPLLLDGYKIVLFNSGVKHSLASSAYNERRLMCEAAVELVKKAHPSVTSLRDLTEEMLNEFVLPVSKEIFEKSLFVVQEIERVQTACADLQNGNLLALGKKMFATHNGLSKMYEVSCSELDFLVNAVKLNENIIGARMMGGGFGGCTINIVKENEVTALIENTTALYKKETGITLETYLVSTENGTQII